MPTGMRRLKQVWDEDENDKLKRIVAVLPLAQPLHQANYGTYSAKRQSVLDPHVSKSIDLENELLEDEVGCGRCAKIGNRRLKGKSVNFRSVNDLFATVRRESHKLPREIDLVIGVPRSGLLAATAVSLLLQRPMVDLNGFLEGRVYDGFSRRVGLRGDRRSPDYRSVLVVDDSIYNGAAMKEVKKRIAKLSPNHEVVYAVVYGLHESHPEVDIVLEKCSAPRVFEWNVLNHPHLNNLCVDLDGVLCCDPDEKEDDDGSNYLEFLNTSKVLVAPRYRVNSIVTARLEKYRAPTEAWLRANDIEYDNLFMLDLPSAADRRRLKAHAEFKSEIYRGKKDCWLFVESSTAQAREIRERSGKSVLAYQDMIFFPEGSMGKIQRATTKSGFRMIADRLLPRRVRPIIKAVLRR